MVNLTSSVPGFVRKNERREVRRAVSLACQVVRERDFQVVADRAIDLSPDGIRVATDADLQPGEGVIVSFQATRLGLWFDTQATVCRVERGRRLGDREPAVGLRFDSLDRVKRFILRGHLRRVPPPVPRRTQRIDWARTVEKFAP